VGGTAAAAHGGHCFSLDVDLVTAQLSNRIDEVNSPGRGVQRGPGGVENESGSGLPQSKALSRTDEGRGIPARVWSAATKRVSA
jgi:hypothetical protein